MTRITQQQIDEWRTTVPHAEPSDLGVEFGNGATPELREDLREYVSHFAKPADIKNRPCLACGDYMGGFTWGLSHGHGHCRECGWPATLYHFIKDRNGGDLATVRGILLQVHPDEVSVKPKKEAHDNAG